MRITPIQCRIARLLAGLSLHRLAEESSVSTGAITALEAGETVPALEIYLIESTLRKHGVRLDRGSR